MVGMEGSAVLAVRKVVVVAREEEPSAGTLQPPRLLHRHPDIRIPATEFRSKGVNWLLII